MCRRQRGILVIGFDDRPVPSQRIGDIAGDLGQIAELHRCPMDRFRLAARRRA